MDRVVQNWVSGELVDVAATEFTELVDPITGWQGPRGQPAGEAPDELA